MTTHFPFLDNPCISLFKIYLFMQLMQKTLSMSFIMYKRPYTGQPAFTASKKQQGIARNPEARWELSQDSRLESEGNQVDK